MEIEITERDEQELMGREDIDIEVSHHGEPTPSSPEIRDKLSAELDLDPKTVEILGVYSSSGSSVSKGTVRVHDEPIYEELPEAGEEPEEDEAPEEEAEAEEEADEGEEPEDDEEEGEEPEETEADEEEEASDDEEDEEADEAEEPEEDDDEQEGGS